MMQVIGKYKIYEDEKRFKIRYRYTLSDFFGSIVYLLSLIIGLFLIYVLVRSFKVDSISTWTVLLASLVFTIFGIYSLVAGFYNPKIGIFQIDKETQEVKIPGLLKTETIKLSSIKSIFHELKSNYKPRMKYSILTVRLSDGTKKDCFIIRSVISVDVGPKVDKDLHKISRQLRDAISLFIKRK